MGAFKPAEFVARDESEGQPPDYLQIVSHTLHDRGCCLSSSEDYRYRGGTAGLRRVGSRAHGSAADLMRVGSTCRDLVGTPALDIDLRRTPAGNFVPYRCARSVSTHSTTSASSARQEVSNGCTFRHGGGLLLFVASWSPLRSSDEWAAAPFYSERHPCRRSCFSVPHELVSLVSGCLSKGFKLSLC